MKSSKLMGCVCLLAVTSSALATSDMASAFQAHPFYISANAGIFQGNFAASYLDQTDIIQQNIAQSMQQYGYTEGLAVGYSRVLYNQYLLGVELSGNLSSHQANFQSGAATTAFSDTTQIKNNVDITIVPGILLGNSLAAYLKLGLSFASIQDNLSSPAGYTPTLTSFNSNKNATGFAAGLGIKKLISEHFSVFAEGNYHDYGTVTFAPFQNFTAGYTHTSHVYSYSVLLGLTYNI